MSHVVNSAIPLSIAMVAAVLLLGLLNLMRQGSANRSQQLMRWRVGLQFIAVVLMMASLYLFRG